MLKINKMKIMLMKEEDFKEELISALSEIKRLRKKNQNSKLLLQEENETKSKTFQALEEAKKLIVDLKVQVEEAKRGRMACKGVRGRRGQKPS